MTEWAEKVLEGVPRHYYANCDRVIMEADALAAIARIGAGDGLVERATAALEGVTDGPWMVAGTRGKLDGQAVHFVFCYNQDKKRDEQIGAFWYDLKTGLGLPDANFAAFTRQWVPEAAARIAALTAQVAENRISEPHDPGDFVGDIYFGHPVKTTMGTHRWTGSEWVKLPSETEALMGLLADARSERDALRATVARLEGALTFYRNGFEKKAKRSKTGLVLSVEYLPTPALLDDCGNCAIDALDAAITDGCKDG